MEIIGEAENGKAALAMISDTHPDLVLLDIQMPVMGGFELLERLTGGPIPVVVMVTAYDQHAIRAFEAGALDYLLKPVSQQRLMQAVDRAKQMHRSPLNVAENLLQLQELASVKRPEEPRVRKLVGKIGEGVFSAESGRSAGVPRDRRTGVDHYGEAAVPGHTEFENDRRAAAEQRLPPDSP